MVQEWPRLVAGGAVVWPEYAKNVHRKLQHIVELGLRMGQERPRLVLGGAAVGPE